MSTDSIIKEIEKLSSEDRLILTQKMIQLIRKAKTTSLKKAVDNLNSDYANDKELTVFTNLDFENFYEAR